MAQPIFKLNKPKPDDFGRKEFSENLSAVCLTKPECPMGHRPAQVQAQQL